MTADLHDPGCIARHRGDCAVSGYFDIQPRTHMLYVLAYKNLHGRWNEWVRSESLARVEDLRRAAENRNPGIEYRIVELTETWRWM